jgi:hypothetical protein
MEILKEGEEIVIKHLGNYHTKLARIYDVRFLVLTLDYGEVVSVPEIV